MIKVTVLVGCPCLHGKHGLDCLMSASKSSWYTVVWGDLMVVHF